MVNELCFGLKNVRRLTVMDEATRECLTLETEISLTGKAVCRTLNRIYVFRGLLKEILTDNSPEFICNALNEWSYDHKVDHIFIDPGKPMQNGYIESCNRKLRDECLN